MHHPVFLRIGDHDLRLRDGHALGMVHFSAIMTVDRSTCTLVYSEVFATETPMVRYTLDSETCRRLAEAEQAVELCDDAGRVIGFFLPEGAARGLPPAGLPIPLSDEEIARRRANRSGRTLEAILRGREPR